MKVRILKAELPSCWYANRIGQVFDVVEETPTHYLLGNDEFGTPCISKSDCELIPDEKPILTPFTFDAWDKDRTQKVWTRDGKEVTQLMYFECEGDTFVGILENVIQTWAKNGRYYGDNEEDENDLFLESTEREYFVNIYQHADGTLESTYIHTKGQSIVSNYDNVKLLHTLTFKA